MGNKHSKTKKQENDTTDIKHIGRIDDIHTVIQFMERPFGLECSTVWYDEYNLYVSKIASDSIVTKYNLKLGAKIVCINGKNIEGFGSKKINEWIEETELPLFVKFRDIKHRKTSLQIFEEYVDSINVHGSPIPHPRVNITLLLIHGFIRDIADNLIIPTEIVSICDLYYNLCSNSSLFLSSAYNKQPALIKLLNINTKQIYDLNITNKDTLQDDERCFIFDTAPSVSITSLPSVIRKNIPSMNINYVDIILRCGGWTENGELADLILFDADYNKMGNNKQIDAYCVGLPSLSSCHSYDNLLDHTAIFDSDNNKIYIVGGHVELMGGYSGFNSMNIYALDLNINEDDEYKYKWTAHKILKMSGDNLSICKVDNYLYRMGGRDKKCERIKIKDDDKFESELIGELNAGRSRASSCYNKDKNRLIVGGGSGNNAGNSIEIYDFEYDKWYLHEARMNYEHSFCAMWTNQYNPDLLYIVGDGYFTSTKFVEWIDLRDNKKNWNILWNQSVTELIGMKHNFQMILL